MSKNYLYIFAVIAVAALGVKSFSVYAQNDSVSRVEKKVIHYVALHATSSEPSYLLIKTGEYVEFDSKDGKSHNIASGVGNGNDEKHDHQQGQVESGEFAPDEGFLAQFNKVGTFYFHDHQNPNINISIGVYDPRLK